MIKKFFHTIGSLLQGLVSAISATILLIRIFLIFGFCHCLWVFRPLSPRWLYLLLWGLATPLWLAGWLFGFSKDKGKNLTTALSALGPIAIKFGQSLSLRPDVVGAEVALALATLQDKLPPFSFRHVEKTILADFGVGWQGIFEKLDETPIASASIAGVYKGVLMGQDVAVKVLRPNIRKRFLRDVARLKNLAHFGEVISPLLKRMNIKAMVTTFEYITEKELDLGLEAASAEELKNNFEKQKKIAGYQFYVPTIHWQAVSKNILTLEWIDGFRLDDEEKLKKYDWDKEKLLDLSAEIFFLQIFRDGFFHADLHGGNLLLTKDGRLAVLDFGIMGRIDRPHQIFLAEMLSGFLAGDYEKVAKAHEKIGLLPAEKLNPEDHADFVNALMVIGKIWLAKNISDISLARFLPHLFATLYRFGMTPKPYLLLLQKTIIMAEGLSRQLSTTTNLWQLAEPFMKKWLKKNYTPHRQLLYLMTHGHLLSVAMRKKIMNDIADEIVNSLSLTNIYDWSLNDMIEKWQGKDWQNLLENLRAMLQDLIDKRKS